jgi:hypothetical protein
VRRYFLIAGGAFLIGVPLLWLVLCLIGAVLAFWSYGDYPSRYEVGVLALTCVIGTVMIVAGLDLLSSAKAASQTRK